jgi:hypothetical protein
MYYTQIVAAIAYLISTILIYINVVQYVYIRHYLPGKYSSCSRAD